MYIRSKAANTITYTSEVCFRKCVDLQNEIHTDEEDRCVKRCVNGYFNTLKELAEEADAKIRK